MREKPPGRDCNNLLPMSSDKGVAHVPGLDQNGAATSRSGLPAIEAANPICERLSFLSMSSEDSTGKVRALSECV